jgi:hypothetical protein
MPVRHLPQITVDDDGLIEVEGLPTGFMRIKRHVIETMASTAKHFLKDKGKPHPVLFERDYFGGGRRGGDIHFCMIWREMGGKVFAAPELRLGHAGSMVLKDSLGASLRRQGNSTLRWLVEQIATRQDGLDTYIEACKASGNRWGAPADILQVAANLARVTEWPILELGTGLSTIVLAAATKHKVWAVEHDPEYAQKLEGMVASAGLSNVTLVTAEIKDSWYDLENVDLPVQFGFAFVDGPPRSGTDRMKFFDALGGRSRYILCDDADDPKYANKLRAWARKHERKIEFDDRSALILPGR